MNHICYPCFPCYLRDLIVNVYLRDLIVNVKVELVEIIVHPQPH